MSIFIKTMKLKTIIPGLLLILVIAASGCTIQKTVDTPTPKTHEEFNHEETITVDLASYCEELSYITVFIPYRGQAIRYDLAGEDSEKVQWLLESLSGTYLYNHYEFVEFKYKGILTSGYSPFIYIDLFDKEDILMETIRLRDYNQDIYRDSETVFYSLVPADWLYHHYSPEKDIDWDLFSYYFDPQYSNQTNAS